MSDGNQIGFFFVAQVKFGGEVHLVQTIKSLLWFFKKLKFFEFRLSREGRDNPSAMEPAITFLSLRELSLGCTPRLLAAVPRRPTRSLSGWVVGRGVGAGEQAYPRTCTSPELQ